MSDDATALTLARWFDTRLHESAGFAIRGCRLYGLEVIDAEALGAGEPWAARVGLIGEADDALAVTRAPGARRVFEFDAAALVSVTWKPTSQAPNCRPGQFAGRRKARVLDLVAGDSAVTVIRFEDDPDFVLLAPAS